MQGELGDIPVDQPFIVVANHPYGILDGLVMGSVLAQSGANFKIIANDIFNKAREISDKILPISFKNTREAISLNLRTRKMQSRIYLMEAQLEFSLEELYPLHQNYFLNQQIHHGDHLQLK